MESSYTEFITNKEQWIAVAGTFDSRLAACAFANTRSCGVRIRVWFFRCCGQRRKTPTGFQVDLRADAIESLSQVRDLIKRQSRDVGLQDTVCSLVLAPELYALSLIERPAVPDDELNEAVRWRIQESLEFPVDEARLDTFALPESALRDQSMVFVAAMLNDGCGWWN
jgi:hypothetical protein